jgi:hypothetical protein
MPAGLGRKGRAAVAAVFSLAGLAALIDPPAARADGLRGTVEFDYTISDSESRNAGAAAVQTDTQSFTQRYRLDIDRTLFPFLKLRGGGLFEKIDSTSTTGGTDIDSTFTRVNPYAELLLGNPLYNAAVGYNRQEEKSEGDAGSSKLIRELYNARIGWLPVDLPTLTAQYTHVATFDPDRVVQDTIQETVLVGSTYKPVKTVELAYQGNWNSSEARVSGVETKDTTHTGRITYGDRLLAGRLSLNGNYNIANRHTETHATRGGEVTTTVQAFAGLFALDDTPLEGALNENPALIDGNLTASAGVDIGLPNPSDPQAFALRNMGLDLLRPDADVSGLLVTVDRSLTETDAPGVAGSFLWAVYVSTNNLDWTLWQAGSPAPFVPFDNRFEIRFPPARTRYVKVVVAPLSATVVGAVNFPDIFVTELQATLTLPAEEVAAESSETSHQVNVAAKARLLDNPNLFYDFSLFHTRNEPSTLSRTFVSNGLSLSHRLNRWLTGSALVARDDSDEPSGRQLIYRYSASLNAVPLRTLSQTVVYSGRTEEVEGVTNVRNSVFLSTRAILYPGVDMLLNAGASEGHKEDGEKTRSYQANLSSDIRPHSTMTWNFFCSADQSERSGGVQPESSTSTRRARGSVAWNPLSAVNLFASAEVVDQETGSTTLYNWSLNWSPFRDGTLQASFAYNESLRPQQDGSDRVVSPSLRWEMRQGTFLNLSYALVKSKTGTQETETGLFSANLQANF